MKDLINLLTKFRASGNTSTLISAMNKNTDILIVATSKEADSLKSKGIIAIPLNKFYSLTGTNIQTNGTILFDNSAITLLAHSIYELQSQYSQLQNKLQKISSIIQE